MREETSVALISKPRHFHTYYNTRSSRLDHVAVFICDEWEQTAVWKPNSEIAEIGFFPLSQLPDGTMDYTRTTLDEIFNGQPARDIW